MNKLYYLSPFLSQNYVKESEDTSNKIMIDVMSLVV